MSTEVTNFSFTKKSLIYRNRGFSLLPLLIAITIIGIIVVPLLNGYVSSWQRTLAADQRSKAHMLARWKLQEQMSIDYASLADQDKASCNLPSNLPEIDKYDCKVVVENVQSSSSNFEVSRIDITIFFNSVDSQGNRSVFCAEITDANCPDLTTFRTKLTK